MTSSGTEFLTKKGIKMLPKRQSIEISALKNRGKLEISKKERINNKNKCKNRDGVCVNAQNQSISFHLVNLILNLVRKFYPIFDQTVSVRTSLITKLWSKL